MTRMGKVLLAVLVLMLTCFLVIGAGSSEVKEQPTRVIKIKVNAINGRLIDMKLEPLNPSHKPQNMVPVPEPYPEFTFRSNILYYRGSNCIVMVIGGRPYQICW